MLCKSFQAQRQLPLLSTSAIQLVARQGKVMGHHLTSHMTQLAFCPPAEGFFGLERLGVAIFFRTPGHDAMSGPSMVEVAYFLPGAPDAETTGVIGVCVALRSEIFEAHHADILPQLSISGPDTRRTAGQAADCCDPGSEDRLVSKRGKQWTLSSPAVSDDPWGMSAGR